MKLLLVKEGCWKAIKEDKPEPVTEAWTSKDELALATIGLAVEDNQLIHIKKAKTACEAWENLEKFHVKRTMSTKVSVMRKICQMRLEKHGDMEIHIAKLTELFEKLNDLEPEKILDDQWLVAILFSSLPEEYETLVTALEARPDEDLTLNLAKGKLLDEWQKRKGRVENSSTESILQAGPKEENRGTCYFCKQLGHQKAKCEKFIKWKAEKSKQKFKKEKANTVIQGNRETEDWAFLTGNSSTSDNQWILDSGATCHIANRRDFFQMFDEKAQDDVWVANGMKERSKGRGSGKIIVLDGNGNRRVITLEDVLFVPNMKSSLLSVKRLVQKGFNITFDETGAKIHRNGVVGAIAELDGNLYILRQICEKTMLVKASKDCVHVWHRRLGHRDCDAILKMKNLATGMQLTSCKCSNACEVCLKGKMQRSSFPKHSESKSTGILDLVHTDICGPMRTVTAGGRRYFLTFIDDYSRYSIVYVLRNKSEALKKFEEYVEMAKTQFGRKPKILRSDRGGEFNGKHFKKFLARNGIIGQLTAPYSPQQNGVAERKNRYLVEMARCMLIDSGLDHRFWGEAIVTANYLQNRLPSRIIEGTPYYQWFGRKPSLEHIHPFGVTVYCHIPSEKRSKLDNKAVKLKFVGYSEVSKAYRLLDVNTGKITISRDVTFLDSGEPTMQIETQQDENEVIVPLLSGPTKDIPVYPILNEMNEDDSDDEVWDDPAVVMNENDVSCERSPRGNENESSLRRSMRNNRGQLPKRYACTVESDEQEPNNLKEALTNKHNNQWQKAMLEELESMKLNDIWDLVDLPAGRRPVGCKWVYKLKRDNDGNISRFKARLVAKGFSQRFGTDYDEVFAPVVRQTTFRTLMSVAAKRKMTVKQYDVKTAFLHGNLEEEIFMKQPPGFAVKGQESKVCRLKKSIYGLKQAARSWNNRLHKILEEEGFKRCDADPCLYRKMMGGRHCYVLIYVDDLIVASEDDRMIEALADVLSRNFEISSLGNVQNYLGIEVERDDAGDYYIHQKKYIKEVIKSTGLQDAKTSAIPLDTGYGKQETIEELLPDNFEYQRLIGQLLYITVNTRPDISAAVSILSRKITKPTKTDWSELKRIVRYLKGTIDLKLRLSNHMDKSGLQGYADADWAESRNDRKSNSGYVFKFHGGTISWACRKQTCVSLSTAEAEFVALSEASQEALWLRRLLKDMDEEQSIITLFEDNQSCLHMLETEKFSNRTKHIDTRYHFTKDLKQTGLITFKYCPTDKMLADLLTKPISRIRMETLRQLCGLLRSSDSRQSSVEEEC